MNPPQLKIARIFRDFFIYDISSEKKEKKNKRFTKIIQRFLSFECCILREPCEREREIEREKNHHNE